MSGKRPCGYFRLGYSMSRRGRIATLHNEFPIGHWNHQFGMHGLIVPELLIFMGIHHTGPYGDETKFYRLPDKDDPEELMSIFPAFHSIAADQLKFIEVMSQHLQRCVSDKNKKIPKAERPRKKRKRKKFGGRRRGYSKKKARKKIEGTRW